MPRRVGILGGRAQQIACRDQDCGAGVSPAHLSVLVLALTATSAAAARLEHADPKTVGMRAAVLNQVDQIVMEGIQQHAMPGAVVLIARQGRVVFLKAYGHRQLQPEPEPMTIDTLFDLASLTKPVVTATCVMKLVEQRQIDLDGPVASYLPAFAQHGKEKITVYHLLTHQGGLIADNPLGDYQDGPDVALQRIYDLKPLCEPGERFIYSDVGYIVLGELVREISGQDLDEFSQEHFFKPLGLGNTSFRPPVDLRRRAATTQQREDRWMRGEVHDPRAYKLGGVAGHAGLFSTAEDLAVYAQMLLDRGTWQDVQVLQPQTVERMTQPRQTAGGHRRALGWDVKSSYSSNRGEAFAPRAYGHGGFTGTVMWVDSELELISVFLSNRVHPDGRGAVNQLAGTINTVVGQAIKRSDVRSSH